MACGGDSGEPIISKKKETTTVKKSVKKVEEDNLKTHIRVLAEDEKSKIPEYLVKIPVQIKQNNKKEK